ncbi:MAG: hypothetical protein ACI9R3_003781 [Verrucomicrobiales bacterium]|jgi:hypothetical protein
MPALEDTPLNRLVTFAVTIAVFGSFGLATGAILLVGTKNSWTQLEAPAAKARQSKIALLDLPDSVDVDAKVAVATLGDSKAVKTEILVPGSPTAIEQAQNPAEQKHDPAESELLDL